MIKYTLDGSDPMNSTMTPVASPANANIPVAGATLKAVALLNGISSALASAVYTPQGGTTATIQSVNGWNGGIAIQFTSALTASPAMGDFQVKLVINNVEQPTSITPTSVYWLGATNPGACDLNVPMVQPANVEQQVSFKVSYKGGTFISQSGTPPYFIVLMQTVNPPMMPFISPAGPNVTLTDMIYITKDAADTMHPNGIIKYTTDETDPFTSGTAQTYSGPFALTVGMGSNPTVKAVVVDGTMVSTLASVTYTVTAAPKLTGSR